MFAEQILAVTIEQPSLAAVESVSRERMGRSKKNLGQPLEGQ